jgi:hypothetical protein
MTILAKIISNYDFKTPKIEMDIEELGNEVILFFLVMHLFVPRTHIPIFRKFYEAISWNKYRYYLTRGDTWKYMKRDGK